MQENTARMMTVIVGISGIGPYVCIRGITNLLINITLINDPQPISNLPVINNSADGTRRRLIVSNSPQLNENIFIKLAPALGVVTQDTLRQHVL